MEKFDFGKLASNMTGRERAMLIIKDFHRKNIGSRCRFLSELDMMALMNQAGTEIKDEMRRTMNLYSNFLYAMMLLNIEFSSFEAVYMRLSNTRLLLSLTGGVSIVIRFLEQKKKEDGVRPYQWDCVMAYFDVIHVIKAKECDLGGNKTLVLREDTKQAMREGMSEVFLCACRVMTIGAVIDKIVDNLGFDPFENQNKLVRPKYRESTVFHYLHEQNEIVLNAFTDNLQEIARRGNEEEARKFDRVLEELTENYIFQQPDVDWQLFATLEKEFLEC